MYIVNLTHSLSIMLGITANGMYCSMYSVLIATLPILISNTIFNFTSHSMHAGTFVTREGRTRSLQDRAIDTPIINIIIVIRTHFLLGSGSTVPSH